MPFFCDSEASRVAIGEQLRVALDERVDAGAFHVVEEGGKCLGFGILSPVSAERFGKPLINGDFEFSLERVEVVDELLEWLAARSEVADETFIIHLGRAYRPLLGRLQGMGLGLDAIVVIGEVGPSLDRLVAATNPPPDLNHLGLSFKRLSSAQEVDAVIELKRLVFSAQPEFCFFGAWPSYLACERGALLEGIGSSDPAWLIVRGGDILGYFSAHLSQEPPFWGSRAGLDVILHPSIQGQGIIKTIYRTLLGELRDRGVRHFIGGTSQPSVLGLSKIMERETLEYIVRPHASFDLEHFGLKQPQGEAV